MTFEAYLEERKIDAQAFKKENPKLWQENEQIFLQVHPNSFTAQKKFMLNTWRRDFPLQKTLKQ